MIPAYRGRYAEILEFSISIVPTPFDVQDDQAFKRRDVVGSSSFHT